ncbi:hypothetical protein [Parashewanella tropica]|uniref:hypothetical protein n=1 Tax=Parashewanella tropica TaxID=2547970 RepID=UPI001059428A|nr:hypothetical protein [Parashewanella tropica]
MEPNYSKYSLEELYDVEANIDSSKYPERLKRIKDEIQLRKPVLLANKQKAPLVDVKDAGVHLTIFNYDENGFELKLSVTYNFLITYQKTWYEIRLTSEQFSDLVYCLKNGIKSWHGSGDLWGASKIFVNEQSSPFQKRDIRLYRRWFILGFCIVPSTLSSVILQALYKVEEQQEALQGS